MREDGMGGRAFAGRHAGAVPSGVGRDVCGCLRPSAAAVSFHAERQDTSAPGRIRLLEVIDEAIADAATPTVRPPPGYVGPCR